MSENRNRDYSKYDAMATEELEEILRLDASAPEGEDSDTELLLYVMGVLANRRRNTDITGKTALESWESFQQNYLDEECLEDMQEPKKNRTAAPWLRRLIAAAAVIALLICLPLSARAFGWEDLWNIFACWAKETFSFVTDESIVENEPSPQYDGEYSSLQDVLRANNRDVDIVPTWIPEEFVLERIEKDITPVQEVYIAFFMHGEQTLEIRIQTYIQGDPGKIEINEELVEIYKSSDIEYYLFTNNEHMHAIWTNDSYECYIAGDLTIEEIKLMIDSIGKG